MEEPGMSVSIDPDPAPRFAQRTGNPIIRDQGICDPHIHVVDGRAWLFCGKDRSWFEDWWVMDEWQVWSSDDLVSWRQENTIRPEDSYTGPNKHCWAGDLAIKDGTWYWYFSNHYTDTGVMCAAGPTEPFRDPLGRPMLPEDITPEGVHPYDPDLFQDDDGSWFIVFGGHGYYIARLKADMLSLAEEPKRLAIDDPRDFCDKPGMFKRDGRYYLQWGGWYATGASPYGPFSTRGRFSDGHCKPFVFQGQWYLGYVQRDALFHRSTYISRLKFREDGSVIFHGTDPHGVGWYDADRPIIDAEDAMRVAGFRAVDGADGRELELALLDEVGELVYPHVRHIRSRGLHLRYRSQSPVVLEIHDDRSGSMQKVELAATEGYETAVLQAGLLPEEADLRLVVRANRDLRFNWLSFDPTQEDAIIPVRQWDFLHGHEGWTRGEMLGQVRHEPGIISGDGHGRDCAITPNFVVTHLQGSKRLLLRLRCSGQVPQATVGFDFMDRQGIFNKTNAWPEAHCVPLDLIADGSFHDYVLDLADLPWWQGVLKRLRIIWEADGPYEWALGYVAIW